MVSSGYDLLELEFTFPTDPKNSKKLLEQNELSDKIKLKDFLGIQKFDTEKLREVIKVIRVHSQDEIEIEWNFDDIFSEQR